MSPSNVANMSRVSEGAIGPTDATDHMCGPETVCQHRGRFYPILERHHEGLWTEQGAHDVRSLRDLPRFDTEEHHIDLPDRRGSIAGVGGMHEDIPQHAFQSQAMRTDGRKM